VQRRLPQHGRHADVLAHHGITGSSSHYGGLPSMCVGNTAQVVYREPFYEETYTLR